MINRIFEILRYGIVGGITTGVNFLLFYLLSFTPINYIVNNVLTYFITVILSFYLNEKFVFTNPNRHSSKFLKLSKYILIRMGSIVADSVLLYICVSIFGYSVIWSKLVIACVIIMLTYIFNKLIVY